MADTISEQVRLVILAGFADEDDRSISMPNPKANISEQEILNLNELAKDVLIGDRYGAAFTSIKSVKKITTRRTDYEL